MGGFLEARKKQNTQRKIMDELSFLNYSPKTKYSEENNG
jgi:hypothetical protein